MKTPLAALRALLVLPLLLCGCGLNVFTTEVKGETVVEGDPSPLGGLLATFPSFGSFAGLDFNANQEFQNQGVKKEQVDSVQVSSLRLRILSPDTQDFGFLDELEFRASAEGLPSVTVATARDIADKGLEAPGPVLELDVTGVELRDYVSAPSMNIEVVGKGRLPPQDTRLEATVGLRVEVHVL